MKPTLIIVEDVDTIRETLVTELSSDFTVLQAVADGHEAVEACQAHHPQLVLMDVVLPRMSGIEATRLILEGNQSAPPKIVMISGLNDEEIVFQALSAGAADYLVKPVEPDKIRDVLLGFARQAA